MLPDDDHSGSTVLMAQKRSRLWLPRNKAVSGDAHRRIVSLTYCLNDEGGMEGIWHVN